MKLAQDFLETFLADESKQSNNLISNYYNYFMTQNIFSDYLKSTAK